MDEVEAWARRIPKIERDQPLLVADGRAYSPAAAVREVEAGTEIGRTLEHKIVARDFTTAEDEYALAKERLSQRLSKLPDSMQIVSLAGTQYSASDALTEIESGSRIGQELLDAEVARITDVLKRR